MIDVDSILFVGVGGDGIITVSNIASETFMLAGFDVKKSEIHGMSQRGGSVSASVRFGKRVYSPTDKLGSVKFMIATEKIEALRWIEYLNEESVVVVNDRIVPIINQNIDEEGIETQMNKFQTKVFIKRRFIDDAKEIGNVKVVNIIMLGVLSNHIPVNEKFFIKAIENIVPYNIRAVNLDAFKFGKELVNNHYR